MTASEPAIPEAIASVCIQCGQSFGTFDANDQVCPDCDQTPEFALRPLSVQRSPDLGRWNDLEKTALAASEPDLKPRAVCAQCGFPIVTTLTTCPSCQHDTRPRNHSVPDRDQSETGSKVLMIVLGGIWILTGFNPIVLVLLTFVLFFVGPFFSLLNKD